MNTDREMLEWAAKAAGIELDWIDDVAYYRNERGGHSRFMPLADDGDAMRLAVKMYIYIQPLEGAKETRVLGSEWFVEGHGADPLAATRRAIVRAAAEIGRAKP